jgi:hypothetical protein
MRKGLVVTLGVVALLLAVSQGFALAPIISCIPDIIVSDSEQNTATGDRNFFIFTNALNLDEYVRDDDTSKTALKWCFVESSPGNSIAVNGIRSYAGTNYRDPVGFNIRAVSQNATVRNIKWSPTTGTLPFANPGVASMDSMVQMVVSDGTKVASQPITVKSVNTLTNAATEQKDKLVGQSAKQYTFATGAEGWTWFDAGTGGGIFPPTSHNATGGALDITENAALNPIVYGAWESPKDPATALKSKFGCILRARYQVRGPATGLASPGFRLRVLWTRVAQIGGAWASDFMSQDMNDDWEVFYSTYDLAAIAVPGREPGATGKTYTALFYPQQIDSLMSTQAVTYITFDLVDNDSFGNDSGTLYVDQVDVDGVDRPEITSPLARAEAALSFTSFSTWSRSIVGIGTGYTSAGLSLTVGASSIDITVAAGNAMLEASAASPGGTALDSGRYYRTIFTVTSTQASGNFGPHIRAGFVSSRYGFSVTKRLRGGGTWSQIGTTPTPLELWMEAPSPYPATGTQSEPIQVRFTTYVDLNPVQPFNRTIAGTLRCTNILTQSFLPF